MNHHFKEGDMVRGESRKKAIIAEYQRQMMTEGRPNYTLITRNVGLKSNVGSYAKRVVQKWLGTQKDRGHVRECLCCDERFISVGKHHRLCDRCRINGESFQPFAISAINHEWRRS
jgi:hypothetical protein